MKSTLKTSILPFRNQIQKSCQHPVIETGKTRAALENSFAVYVAPDRPWDDRYVKLRGAGSRQKIQNTRLLRNGIRRVREVNTATLHRV